MAYVLKLAAAGIALAACTATANAFDATNVCKAYARAAIVQYNDQKTLGCGFTGPRWNYTYEHHYDYCMGGYQANENFDPTPEREARKSEIAQCKAAKAGGGGGDAPKPAAKLGKVNADVDLYDEPGGNGNVVGMWPAGTQLRFNCNSDNWCKVQGGWIYGDFLDR